LKILALDKTGNRMSEQSGTSLPSTLKGKTINKLANIQRGLDASSSALVRKYINKLLITAILLERLYIFNRSLHTIYVRSSTYIRSLRLGSIFFFTNHFFTKQLYHIRIRTLPSGCFLLWSDTKNFNLCSRPHSLN